MRRMIMMKKINKKGLDAPGTLGTLIVLLLVIALIFYLLSGGPGGTAMRGIKWSTDEQAIRGLIETNSCDEVGDTACITGYEAVCHVNTDGNKVYTPSGDKLTKCDS